MAAPAKLIESAPPRHSPQCLRAPFRFRHCRCPHLLRTPPHRPEEITEKQRVNIGAPLSTRPSHRLPHAHFELARKHQSPIVCRSSTRIPFTIPSSKASATSASIRAGLRPSRRSLLQPAMPRKSMNKPSPAPELLSRAFRSPHRRPRTILNDIWHVSSMSNPKRLQKIERSAEKRASKSPATSCRRRLHHHGHTISGIVLHRLWRMSAPRHAQRSPRRHRRDAAHVKEIDASSSIAWYGTSRGII